MSAPVTAAGGSSAADPLLPPAAAGAAATGACASVLERLESLINHEKRPQSARAWGLDRVYKVAGRLGCPGDRYPTIHITGTKGKGTTAHLIARLLQAGGRRVGLYTSPHVRDVRERIKIDGQPIDPAAFARAFDTVWNSFPGLVDEHERPVSYFEMMTHTAFVAFQQAGVDFAVIEVGLGGTLDATNILTAPRACVLTPISLDHVKILGSTVEAIAQDKSGIIKPGAQVIVADQPAGARDVIHARAREVRVPGLWQVGRDVTYRWQAIADPPPVAPIAPGADGGASGGQCRYEVTVTTPAGEATLPLSVPAQAGAGNVATAWSTLVSLGLAPSPAIARAALADFAVEGRFERLRAAGRDWLFDGAHNVAATAFLIEAVRNAYPDRDLTLVFGCMSDKDAQQMLEMWRPHLKRIVCTRALSHRATDLTDLAQVAQAAGIAEVIAAPALADMPALAVSLTAGDAAPLILVTGSFYLVGDLLAVLGGR